MTIPAHRDGMVAPPVGAVRQGSLRAINLALVFRQIVAAGGRSISRTELAAATGLTRPTISRIVDELLDNHLVTEVRLIHDGRAGRPRVGLVLSRQGPAGLGLDVREDGLAVCVIDLAGGVRHLNFAPIPASHEPARILADLARMARDAVSAAAAEGLTVVGLTLAVPGPVEAGSIVRFAPALGWRDVDAGAQLRHVLGPLDVPVTVDNEANLAALAELYAGGDRARSFVYVSGSLGLGAGIVMDGRLMRGSRGWSGELGHVSVYPDGTRCACGADGCLQAYAGLDAVLGAAPVRDATLAATIISLADANSAPTLVALNTAARALGIALSHLVNLLDIDTVLLGGSYALLASWLTNGVREELARRVLTAGWSPIDVRPALLGPDAAVIGAALTSIDHVRHDPSTWVAGGQPVAVPAEQAQRETVDGRSVRADQPAAGVPTTAGAR